MFYLLKALLSDVCNLQNGHVLLVPFCPAVAGAAFLFEYQNFIGALMLDYFRADFGGFAASREKNGVIGEIDGIPFVQVEFFDPDSVVFSDFVLFSACANDCKHSQFLMFSGLRTCA
jgi:hypothetical protein